MEFWCVFLLLLFELVPKPQVNLMIKTWLIQVSVCVCGGGGVSVGNSSVPQIKVRNRKLFSYFSAKKYVVCTQNDLLDDTVLLST